jgi:hypothetical protein
VELEVIKRIAGLNCSFSFHIIWSIFSQLAGGIAYQDNVKMNETCGYMNLSSMVSLDPPVILFLRLVCGRCVPLHDFNYIYNYLLGARMSFVDWYVMIYFTILYIDNFFQSLALNCLLLS